MNSKEWKKYRLDDLVDNNRGISYGIVQPGQFLEEGGVPILKVNNLTENKTELQDVFRVSHEIESKYERTRLRGNEILVSLVGSLGYIFKTSEKHKGWNVVRAIGVLPIKKGINRDWVYWYLKSPEIQAAFQNNATVTVQATLNLKELREFEIPLPDENTQQRIASILSALDEKIELNRQTNATLEAMAQAIFKEWFLDFNFPGATGEMVESALGMIPRGWRVGKVEELCNVNQNVITKNDYFDWIDYIEISEVSKGKIANSTRYKYGEEPSRAKRKLSHGDVVLSTVRPNRGSFFLSINPPKTLIASTGFAVFSPIRAPFSFLYLFLTASEKLEYYGHVADGAAYPAINPNLIMKMDLVIPENGILDHFHSIAEPILNNISHNEQESQNLAAIRDALLRKLMSGEIDVGEFICDDLT